MKAKKQATQGWIPHLANVNRYPNVEFCAAADGTVPSTAPKRPVVQMPDEYLPPNRVLFLQNLPAETITKEALQDLFGQYVGRLIETIVPSLTSSVQVPKPYRNSDSAHKEGYCIRRIRRRR